MAGIAGMNAMAIACYIQLHDAPSPFYKGALLDRLDKCSRSPDRYRYKLHNSPPGRYTEEKTVELMMDEVSPVYGDDHKYLLHISNPRARFNVYNSPNKLHWAKGLRSGDRVYARLRHGSTEEENYPLQLTPVYIQSIGRTKIGFKFQVATSMSSTTKEFVDLDRLEFSPSMPDSLPDCVPSLYVYPSKEYRDLQKQHGKLRYDYSMLRLKMDEKEEQWQRFLKRWHEEWVSKLEQKDEECEKRLKEKEEQQKNLVEHFQEEMDALIEEKKRLNDRHKQQVTHTWEIDREHLKLGEIIATGGWGKVIRAKYWGSPVAVKQLHDHIVSEHNEGMVRREINIMAQVRHPNLLLFIGAIIVPNVEQGGASSLIVTELLDTCLRSAYQQNKIPTGSKISILYDVSCGLTYLHTRRDPIIHRDVSSANVLLEAVRGSRQWKAKLSDFGSANIFSKAVTPNVGAVIYAAPETISESAAPQTTKVDVFSFGVLTCEIVLLKPPPDERRDFPLMLSEVQKSNADLFALAKDCTKRLPEQRLTMTQITEQLSRY